jgi:single stranded DNA-binding protein
MASLNRVLLIGNLTRDPEVRHTSNKGTAVCDIGLAINRIVGGDEGEKKEETTFVDVTLWGRQAEIAGQFLKKGRPVFIEGRLRTETWEQDGRSARASRWFVKIFNSSASVQNRERDLPEVIAATKHIPEPSSGQPLELKCQNTSRMTFFGRKKSEICTFGLFLVRDSRRHFSILETITRSNGVITSDNLVHPK